MRSLYDRECPETWRKSFNRTQNGNKFDGFRQNNNRIMYRRSLYCVIMFDASVRVQCLIYWIEYKGAPRRRDRCRRRCHCRPKRFHAR